MFHVLIIPPFENCTIFMDFWIDVQKKSAEDFRKRTSYYFHENLPKRLLKMLSLAENLGRKFGIFVFVL